MPDFFHKSGSTWFHCVVPRHETCSSVLNWWPWSRPIAAHCISLHDVYPRLSEYLIVLHSSSVGPCRKSSLRHRSSVRSLYPDEMQVRIREDAGFVMTYLCSPGYCSRAAIIMHRIWSRVRTSLSFPRGAWPAFVTLQFCNSQTTNCQVLELRARARRAFGLLQ